MALTSIGFQKTPGRPVEITFAAEGGLPNPNQTVCLVGHMGPTGGAAVSGVASGSATPYVVTVLSNVADSAAGAVEANAKFGSGSELAKMVIACIKANEAAGNSNFPQLVAVPLQQTDTDFGPDDVAGVPAALSAARAYGEIEFIVSPYDGQDTILTGELEETAETMSGAQRVQNNQYGTVGVAFNRDEVDPADLEDYDSRFLTLAWLRDTGTGDDAPEYSIGECAAAYAGLIGGLTIPFNPLDGAVVGALAAPAKNTDWITVGAGLESESALNQGWTPLRVLPNGDVAVVRSVTARLTSNGTTPVTAYYDVQDYMVLYFFRKAVVTRLNQPDFARTKASEGVAKRMLSEIIRLASAFEDQGMFQNVSGLAKQFVIERNASDRHRFDIFVPVNVVPGLHVVAVNEQATTEGDLFTV